MCCVLFDGHGEQSPKYHEHKRRQTGNVSATIMIADNEKVHRDQPAYFSNEKNETTSSRLLTKHVRDIGSHIEVIRDDADTLILSNALEFAQNVQTSRQSHASSQGMGIEHG